MRESKIAQKTTLLSRILFRLVPPFIFLAFLFATIQLTYQINVMNQLLQMKSEVALTEIQKTLAEDIRIQQQAEDWSSLKTKLEKLRETYRVSEIQMLNLFEKTFLFPETETPWTAEDDLAADESLNQKQLGKSYSIHINRDTKQLMVYLPFQDAGTGANTGQIWIARIIFPLSTFGEALRESRWILGITLLLILIIGVIIGRSLAKSIVDPIQKLNKGTREIMHGNLNARVSIETGDEIEVLAHTFNQMSETIKKMKQKAEEANPLTHLPGNESVTEELNRRIYERKKFVFFHVDLNRFKVFNDHFGLSRGDTAIKCTAEVLKRAVKEKGAEDDFVGHYGGDDFVIITLPNRAKAVGELVCQLFEAQALPLLYEKKDLDLGYTLHEDRRRFTETGEHATVQFPLLSVSLAGVANTKRDFADSKECLKFAVSVKTEVKKNDRSSYLIQE